MLIVDQSSLNKVIADASYQLKSDHFLFKNDTMAALSTRQRFSAMLKSDPAHMLPAEKGQAVNYIQFALIKVYELGPLTDPATFKNFGVVGHDNECASRRYGPHSQAYITSLKESYRILNYLNKIDPIVGKKTIRALDFILWRNGE